MSATKCSRYQLDLRLVPRTDARTGKIKPGFETVAGCVAEVNPTVPGHCEKSQSAFVRTPAASGRSHLTASPLSASTSIQARHSAWPTTWKLAPKR